MDMIKAWMLAALVFAGAGMAEASAGDADGTIQVRGVVAIGVDGAVDTVRLAPGLPDEVARAVEREVAGWRFEPIVYDGVPAPVTTGLSLRLNAREHDAGVVLEVADVAFGARPVHAVPPRYPPGALSVGAGASVELRVLVGDDGEVVDTHVHRTVLTTGRLSAVERAQLRVQFERAIAGAVAQWRFDPSLVPAGSTMPYTVDLNVDGGPRPRGGPRTTEFGDAAPAPWQHGDPHHGLWAANGVVLADEVIGRIL